MELHDIPYLWSGPDKVFPSPEYKYPFYEILSERRVPKAAVIPHLFAKKAGTYSEPYLLH
jgi:hypothetical protein